MIPKKPLQQVLENELKFRTDIDSDDLQNVIRFLESSKPNAENGGNPLNRNANLQSKSPSAKNGELSREVPSNNQRANRTVKDRKRVYREIICKAEIGEDEKSIEANIGTESDQCAGENFR